MEKTYAGLILSAGYSSRMGDIKALLPLKGETLITRQICCFLSAGISDVYVVLGHRAEEIRQALSDFPVTTVYNENYPSGMFTSVQAGVRAIRQKTYDGVFLLPVDYALAQPFTIAALAGRFEQDGASVVYPCFDGRKGHPPLFSFSLIDEILSSPADAGLKSVFERHAGEAAYEQVGNATCLIDIDSQQDYREALHYLKTHTAPDMRECEFIYKYYNVPEPVKAHCALVARTAKTLAEALKRKGYDVNADIVFCGGLLHDIRKGAKNHAAQGAETLASMGYPSVAKIIANHMDIADEYTKSICNESVLYFADKVTEQTEIMELANRSLLMDEKYGGDDERRRRAQDRLKTAANIQTIFEAALNADVMQLIKQPPLA